MKEYRVPYEKPGDATKEGEEELGVTATTRYRAVAARANYVALDRPDIQYTVKELCRGMSKPKRKDWVALERLGRYLHGRPRLVQTFEWQAQDQNINAYSDADWASCKDTRKSTSGGALMWGSHCLRSWSKTQTVIAQSSAESELTATVKTTSETLGLIAMARIHIKVIIQ